MASEEDRAAKRKVARGAMLRLREVALRYARMKTFGGVLDEKGCWSMVCKSDQQERSDFYLRHLGQEAVNLLMEIGTLPSEAWRPQ